MTAGEALRALHKAGRIRSPWLAGMRVWSPSCWLAAAGLRIVAVHRGSAGGRVEVTAGRQTYTVDREGSTTYPWSPECGPPVVQRVPHASPDTWEPDLTDPATVGCLLALLREAKGEAIAAALIALAGAL